MYLHCDNTDHAMETDRPNTDDAMETDRPILSNVDAARMITTTEGTVHALSCTYVYTCSVNCHSQGFRYKS